jgi:hypothetical protein
MTLKPIRHAMRGYRPTEQSQRLAESKTRYLPRISAAPAVPAARVPAQALPQDAS